MKLNERQIRRISLVGILAMIFVLGVFPQGLIRTLIILILASAVLSISINYLRKQWENDERKD